MEAKYKNLEDSNRSFPNYWAKSSLGTKNVAKLVAQDVKKILSSNSTFTKETRGAKRAKNS